MHVMVISHGVPTEKYPTNGIFQFDQARALRDIGVKVTMLVFDARSIRRKRKWGLTYNALDQIDVFTVNVPLGPVPETIHRFFRSRCAPVLVKRAIDAVGVPDVLHAHFAGMGELGLWIKRNYGVPLVYTEHASGVMKDDERYLHMARKVWRGSDSLIAVSSALAEKIGEVWADKAVVVGNVVDREFLSMNLAQRTGSMRFVSVGSLIPGKGHDVLIEAFAGLPEHATLNIFGDGPQKDNLRQEASILGVDGRVFFRGLCHRNEIASCLAESDCFVLASRSETFGVAYIEALAMGLPVVATQCGGPDDFVTEKCGRLAPIDDVEAIRSAMVDVGSSSDFDADEIRRYTAKRYSPESIAEQLCAIYQSLEARASCSSAHESAE